jgi:hypothetical protein
MNELDDIKLRALLQNLELDKPKSDFSTNVMNQLFAEEKAFDKIKNERIFGKMFWIVSVTFIVIILTIIVFSGYNSPEKSLLGNYVSSFGREIIAGSQIAFVKIGNLPIGIAGGLIASSILLFLDRFISANSKIFSDK